MITGIYKITSPSGKIYIGQSIDIENRWLIYEKYTNSCKNQVKLYNSLMKYGWNNHDKEILEECSCDQLLERETYWKEYYNVLKIPSLCCRTDGRGGRLSEETKQKIKQHKLDNPMSQETRDIISKANLSKIYSKESKEKISKAKKGNKCYTQEWKDKISASLQNMDIDKKKLRADKISNKTKGKSKPKGFSQKISKCIIQYDINGNFIKEWSSIKEAEMFYYGRQNGSIGACCNGKFKHVKNFKWRHKHEFRS